MLTYQHTNTNIHLYNNNITITNTTNTTTTNITITIRYELHRKDQEDDRGGMYGEHSGRHGKDNDEGEGEEELRCPICTLTVPCPHFFKREILAKFFSKNAEEGNGPTGKFSFIVHL